MKQVSQEEAALLTVARVLVGEGSALVAEPILRLGRELPERISPDAIDLLEHTLAVGSVRELVRRGGWCDMRTVSNGQVVSGRLWERHGVPELRFTARTMRLLRWMTLTPLGLPKSAAPPKGDGATLADQLVAYLAVDLLEQTGCTACLPGFARWPLCWLGFAHQLAPALFDNGPTQAQMVALIRNHGLLLESLQLDLADRWVGMEESKRSITKPKQTGDLGGAQEAVLNAFLGACEETGRFDLARFVVDAGARLLRRKLSASFFVDGLDVNAPLSERSRARQGAGAFLRGVLRVARWSEGWRGMPFFEEGFATAQMFLKEWEPLGPEELARASAVLTELGRLDVPTAQSES